MRRARLCALGLAVLLAGCVAVPVSGPVERHSAAQQQANPGVEIAPVPPAQGASPALIVEGFLHAMATYQAGYSVARQFLTPDAADAWRPETGVEIYANDFPPQVSSSGVVLTAPLVGTLDAQGSFTPTPASTQFAHDFGLVRDRDDQWRISRPPRGLLISQSLFSSSWTLARVCFWDATGNWLVPDPRFVRKGSLGMPAIVRAILSGPAIGARDAYRAALTPALDVSAVTLGANGVATVELTGGVEELNADARRRLAAELVWSLTSVEAVTGLRVRGNGSSWELSSGGGPVTPADLAEGAPVPTTVADQVFVLRDGVVARGSWDDPSLEPQPVGAALARPIGLAARADGQLVAVITDAGTRVRSVPVREGAPRTELSGSGFSVVRWTRQGELLVAQDRTRSTRLRMIREGRQVLVDTDALPAGRIRSFGFAPDGVRVAFVIEQSGRPVLGVAAMVRGQDRVRFTGWREFSGAAWAPRTQPALDVGWTGPTGLMVLLNGPGTARVISVDSEGAMATEVGPIEAAIGGQLAVAPGGRAILRGSDGQTWRLADEFTWEPWLAKVQQVSLP